jgi:hypothetical protein
MERLIRAASLAAASAPKTNPSMRPLRPSMLSHEAASTAVNLMHSGNSSHSVRVF